MIDPGFMFPFMMLLGLVFYGILLWFAWILVSSVRGMHTELTRIREELGRMSGPGGG